MSELQLKKISPEYITKALDKAEKYRMLNHPKTSESICRDVLEIDPHHQDAIVQLIISITGQFSNPGKYPGTKLKNAQEWVSKLDNEYLRLYLSGLILERWAKAKVRDLPGTDIYEYLHEATEFYEKAEKIRPADDESVILHYNFCVRFIDRHPHIKPPRETADASRAHSYGDGFIPH